MNKPDIRFNGFNGEWEEKKINEISEINPHSELPVQFEYVDLESVSGTEMVSHRTERLESAPSRAQRLAQKGDIFYQTVRPYQKNNYYFNLNEKDYVFSTGYAQLRSKLDGNFFLSVLQSDKFVADVLENCTGTSYPAINPTTLGNLKVAFPDNAEQKKLGALFSQMDSLIASTQKEHDKLVSLKKCMLQKMFPKKGCLVPEIRFKGFSGDWVEKKYQEIFDTSISNNTLSRSELINEKTVIKNVHYGDILIKYGSILDVEKDDFQFVPDLIKINSKNFLKNGDIVFADTAEDETCGKATEINNLGKDCVVAGLHTFVARPREAFANFFLGYFINSPCYHNQLIPYMQGTKVTSISKSNMYKSVLFYPSLPEQQKIGSYFQNLDNLISKQSAELEKLKNVKKTLLSKMFV